MQEGNPVLEKIAWLRRELTALERMKIHVGIQSTEDSKLLIIAAVHEYGATIEMTDKMRRYLGAMGLFDDAKDYTPPAGHVKGFINIPERSFIRASYDTGKNRINEIVSAAIARLFSGERTARETMEAIGAQLADMTREYIGSGSVTPEKSGFTQEHTSQYTPLVDSGRLQESITYTIEEG